MNSASAFSIVLALAAVAGCQVFSRASIDPSSAESAPFMTLDQFATALDCEDEALLVEFCVPVGCSRCDHTAEPIQRLAYRRQDQITLCRLDLNQHLQLAWEFRLSSTPSYVVFRGGEEVFRASHPTSADLIASEIDDYLDELISGHFAIADR